MAQHTKILQTETFAIKHRVPTVYTAKLKRDVTENAVRAQILEKGLVTEGPISTRILGPVENDPDHYWVAAFVEVWSDPWLDRFRRA